MTWKQEDKKNMESYTVWYRALEDPTNDMNSFKVNSFSMSLKMSFFM